MQIIKTTQEYRERMLGIMEYIQGVCEKNGLNCFLSGGTLLGAIRHKGFIPWDDDTDMMMLREDYERLTRIINSDDSPYYMLRVTTDSEYYYPFAKVVDLRTGLREDDRIPISLLGIGVDIFPIDKLPKDKETIAKVLYQERKLTETYKQKLCVPKQVVDNRYLQRLYRSNLRFMARQIERKAIKAHRRYSVGQLQRVGVLVWGYGAKEIVPLQAMEKAMPVEFEDRSFMAPVGYDIYLSRLYGDYMTPPPKAKRHNEHRARAWYRE